MPSEPSPPRFLRDGLLWASAPGRALGGARPVGGGRFLEPRRWAPGESVGGALAPTRAECVGLFSVPLGDVARRVAMGAEAPDTAMAFDPSGDRLAIGSALGDVLVTDAWDGTVKVRRHLSEALVKQVAWSPDGRVLYAAEQSPDAYVHALDAADLHTLWSFRLADQIGSSPLPDDQDVYGIYGLPAALSLDVLDDGSLLVAASHGWTDAHGARANLARLVRLSANGAEVAGWPTEPSSITLWNPRVVGGRLAVFVGRSAAGPPPAGLPVGGVALLDAQTLALQGSFVPAPLTPTFQSTFVWDALDVDAATGRLLVGLGDGRVFLRSADGGPLAEWDVGTPVVAANVPIASTIGHGRLSGSSAFFTTSGTSIPYGSAAPDARPPALHPHANAVWAKGVDGSDLWSWRGAYRLQGLAVEPGGHWLVVGAGARDGDDRRDLFGALVLAADDRARGGDDRLLAVCPTASPVFFRFAVASDGRIAVAEVPGRAVDGTVFGDYRVTVLR